MSNDDVKGTYHFMHCKQIFDYKHTLKERKMMGAIYM